MTSLRRRAFACLWVSAAGLGLVAIAGTPAHAQLPGAESFVKPLKTPLDFWEVSDYLVRTGQVKAAVPFLTKFDTAKPDDDTLVRIREEYGHNSILRLLDHKETREIGERLTKAVSEAGRRVATRPERLNAAINALTKSNAERSIALESLREAGAYAVPSLITAIQDANLTPQKREAIVRGMGQLDASAEPPLVAALDSGSPVLISAVLEVLGNIGDARALPDLMIAATSTKPEVASAQDAIASLTGNKFSLQPNSPIRVLDNAARSAFLALPSIPFAPDNLWSWDAASNNVVAKPSNRAEVAATRGLKYARAATKLDPKDLSAKLNYLSLALERDPASAAADATAAGPDVLGQLVKRAIDDGRYGLAASAVPLLGKATNPAALTSQNCEKLSPLVQALGSIDRRVQFAAAEAIITLNPRRGFPGSSRVVPTLSRFASLGSYPRAIVIDGNPNRGSQTVGYLKILGYDAHLAPTGESGFKLAAECADVELIAIDPDLVQGAWRLSDTLANLHADFHTSGIPVFIVGSLSYREHVAPKLESFPNVQYLITPTEATLFKRQVDAGLANVRARPLTVEERTNMAIKASNLLGQIATNSGNPFEGDLSLAAPSLTIALNTPATAAQAAAALGDLPRVEAQRDLADVVLNPSLDAELRIAASGQLVKSIKRFGPLVSNDQEHRLVALIKSNSEEPPVFTALSSVADALKRKPTTTSPRPAQAQRPGVSSTR